MDTGTPLKKLRSFITDRQYQSGDRLPTQQELSRLLNIGSRPLREALSVLKKDGIIAVRGRAGTVIATPSLDSIIEPVEWYLRDKDYTTKDLIIARAALESSVVVVACKERTAQDLLKILDALEKMKLKYASKKLYIEDDEHFHMHILKATHNPVLEILSTVVHSQFKKIPLKKYYRLQKEYIQRHRAIYRAIHDRKSSEARELLWNHIMSWL